jgi:hypothetical protein
MTGDAPPRKPGQAFIADTAAPTGSRFECAACGWSGCRRVTVRRPDGSHYSTEFVSCDGCRVLYHWAAEVPQKGQPVPAPGLPEHYMAGLGEPHDSGMSEEQLREIQAAAERARKGRSWKARKR